VRLLLDSHVVLWHLTDDPAQRISTRALIVDPDNDVLVSAASVWELSIKQAAGRLEAPDDLLVQLAEHELEQLPITSEHALRAARLPAHHADPFDRMLVAQAQLEGLTLITRDRRLSAYDVASHPA
jgi:PIN domain nuclease of toxin-antitoxin system